MPGGHKNGIAKCHSHFHQPTHMPQDTYNAVVSTKPFKLQIIPHHTNPGIRGRFLPALRWVLALLYPMAVSMRSWDKPLGPLANRFKSFVNFQPLPHRRGQPPQKCILLMLNQKRLHTYLPGNCPLGKCPPPREIGHQVVLSHF